MTDSIGFFTSFSKFSIVSIVLALIFGVIWLFPAYRPNFIRRPGLWLVLVISAVLTLAAIAFVQIPLQSWVGQAIVALFSRETIISWLLLIAVPQIALSGLVQEAAKLIPVVGYRWLGRGSIDARVALGVGAVAGAGFGIFEAQWVMHTIVTSGWGWDSVQAGGLMAFAGFWERFFAVGFHTASTALAAWGLVRGWGWQFYLLAALAHTVLNYSVVLMQAGILSLSQIEIYAAVVALIVFGITLLLLRKARASETLISSLK